MPGGRPSVYTEELAERICREIANGRGLAAICREDWAPDKSTVYHWLNGRSGAPAEFFDLYAKAREVQAETMADQIVEIADDQSDDANSRRVRVDARKWVAAKLLPRRFGDRVEQTGSVEVRHVIHVGPPPK